MQVLVVVWLTDGVVVIHVELHLKLFACFHESIGVEQCVLCMYVVVCQTMYNQ